MFSTFSSLSSNIVKNQKTSSLLGLGSVWANISSSLNVQNTSGYCSNDRSYIFGIFNGVLYMSTDVGLNWTNIQSRISNLTPTWVICSQTGQYVFVRTTNPTYNWVSSDYGSSFASYGVQTSGPNVFMDKTGQYGIHGTNTTSSTKAIYVTSNYGVTWTDVSSTIPGWGTTITTKNFNSACICSGDPNKIMVSSASSEGTFYSSNFGSSWTLVNPNGTAGAYSVSCSENGKFYACANSSLYYTSNPTSGWTALSGISGFPTAINIVSAGGTSVIAHSSTSKQIWYSVDGGTSWTLNSSVPGGTQTTNASYCISNHNGQTFLTGWNTTTKNMYITY